LPRWWILSSETALNANSRRSKQARLNDLKYDLMVINQDLGRMVPASRLASDLVIRRESLQAEITVLEQELAKKPEKKSETQEPAPIRKYQDDEGHIRIWPSS
jgi:hypothetical protein